MLCCVQQVLIYVDVVAAMSDGIVFFRSSNNVILTCERKSTFLYPCGLTYTSVSTVRETIPFRVHATYLNVSLTSCERKRTLPCPGALLELQAQLL